MLTAALVAQPSIELLLPVVIRNRLQAPMLLMHRVQDPLRRWLSSSCGASAAGTTRLSRVHMVQL